MLSLPRNRRYTGRYKDVSRFISKVRTHKLKLRVDVCYAAHCGLKSDMPALPRSGHQPTSARTAYDVVSNGERVVLCILPSTVD